MGKLFTFSTMDVIFAFVSVVFSDVRSICPMHAASISGLFHFCRLFFISCNSFSIVCITIFYLLLYQLLLSPARHLPVKLSCLLQIYHFLPLFRMKLKAIF